MPHSSTIQIPSKGSNQWMRSTVVRVPCFHRCFWGTKCLRWRTASILKSRQRPCSETWSSNTAQSLYQLPHLSLTWLPMLVTFLNAQQHRTLRVWTLKSCLCLTPRSSRCQMMTKWERLESWSTKLRWKECCSRCMGASLVRINCSSCT